MSSDEVVRAHLRQIERVNPRLNAVVQLAADEALAAARRADAALARGQPVGPLHGVPFTVKDWIDAAETCRQAAGVLADCGARVEEALPPRIEEAYFITRQYWQRPESADAEEWVSQGDFSLSSEEVARNLFMWDRFRRALIAFMADYDAILTPVAELPSMPHGENAGGIPYTLPYSLTGYPCAVVRGGTSPEGLPIGVQVVARPWRDDVALAAAQELEKALGGWQPPHHPIHAPTPEDKRSH